MKSAVPVQHGFPNPSYTRARGLVDRQEEIRRLVRQIQKVGDENRDDVGFDLKAVMTALEGTSVKERLRELWESQSSSQQAKPVMGPPPRPNTLYGRFGKGVSVFDIGSGNCAKLVPFSGVLKITASDVKDITTVHVFKVRLGPFLDHFGTLGAELLTSFMSLTQLSAAELGMVKERDGMHVIPDLPVLLGNGTAYKCGNRVLVRTPRGTFDDAYVDLPGYVPKVGYKVCPIYQARDVVVALSPEGNTVTDTIEVDATPAGIEDINLHDVSYKYDGVPFELEIFQKQAMLTNRAGLQFIGESDFGEHLCLHVERMEGSFRLIRVLAYRGMIPPHCGDTLRYFAERVKVTINDMPVLGPEKWDPGRPFPIYVDGLISRTNERDFYHKFVWTVELVPGQNEKLCKELQSKGLVLRSQLTEGLWEYKMWREGGEVFLNPIRERFDKMRPTTVETVLYLLEKKTLPEVQALEHQFATER